MHLTYKYRLLPTKAQHGDLARVLEMQRQLYNAALQERIDCYRKTGRTISFGDQCRSLTVWRRDDADAAGILRSIHHETIQRLDRAYQGFFRRVKNGEKPGFPRFRGYSRWATFGIGDARYLYFKNGRMRIKGIGGPLRLHMHRPLPAEHKLCLVSFTRDTKGWSVSLQVDVPSQDRRPVSSMVGIDLGLKTLASTTDGLEIPNPRIARKAERKMRIQQRALARCKRGSNRRRKAKARLTAAYSKIKNSRRTYLHGVTAKLARSYDLIAVESLNVKGLARSHVSKSVADAGWSTLVDMLRYKAERAGGTLIEVDPRLTTQACSGCGVIVPKGLADRVHSCPDCGLIMDRDTNAAWNILHKAVAGLGLRNVTDGGGRGAGNIKGEVQ